MAEMSLEEKALERARARLGDLVAQTIASSGMDRAELKKRIHAAQIEVYRAEVVAQEAHRRAQLAIVDQQATPEAMNNPQLSRFLEERRRSINAKVDKEISLLKLHLEEALGARDE